MASFTQTRFRFRNDDGSETTATWKDSENVNITMGVDTNFRVRIQVDETTPTTWATTRWNYYYSKNGGAYEIISGTTPIKYSLSGNFANGDDSTAQMTAPTGTFLANNNQMRESTTSLTNTSTGSGQYFEAELCLTLDSTQIADADTYDIRVYYGLGTPCDTYSQTPRVTSSTAAGALTINKSDSVTLP
jgi:hypothetical protein